MAMAQQQQRQPAPAKPDVSKMLADPKFKMEIQRALPKHMTPDRMLRIVLTECRKNPKLMRCDPYSFMGAIIQAAQLGLEPGSALGHAYLIPYGAEVNMITGYRGYIDLARRSGKVDAFNAECVYRGDHFKYGYRDGLPFMEWEPQMGVIKKPDDIVAVFAAARFISGGAQFAVMTREQVEEVRQMSKNRNPVWENHYGEMTRKTAVRRLAKYLPLSPEVATVMELDDATETGRSQQGHQFFVDAGVLDTDYEPRETLSEDATTHAEMNREQEAATAQKTLAELKAEFIQKAGAMAKDGAKLEDIYKHCGLEDGRAVNNLTDAAAIAVLQQLKTFPGTKK